MGWARTLLLGDIGNRLDIEDTENDITDLKRDLYDVYRKDRSQDEIIEDLAKENAELKLFLASIIRLLVTKDVISRREVYDMVNAIDAEDGQSDGKYSGPIA